MTSTLSVSKIQGLSTAAAPTTVEIASGHKLTGAAGSITVPSMHIQTVLAHMAQTTVTISSTSFVDTGLNVSITSKNASSKFLVSVTGGGYYGKVNSNQAMYVTVQRNASGGSYDYATGAYGNNYGLMRLSADNDQWNIKPYSGTCLDAPSAGAGVVLNYRVMARVNSNSADFQASDRGLPTITVTEIAQ